MIFCNTTVCIELRAAIILCGLMLTMNSTVAAVMHSEKVDVQAIDIDPGRQSGPKVEPTKPGEKLLMPLPEQRQASAAELDRAPPRQPVADDPAIRNAIAAELAATGKQPRLGIPLSEFRVLPIERFAKKFTEAKVPDCLHGDALKRQPPVILFVKFEGLYAVPFVVLAKLRGKCI